jgi:HlyD family secretion protein
MDALSGTTTDAHRSASAPPRVSRVRGVRLRRWAAILLGLGVIGAGGAYYATLSGSGQPASVEAVKASALTVTVATVSDGLIPRTLVVTGSLAARDELPIGTETTGLALSEVLVDVGDHVQKGQVLARFNDRLLRAQLQQMQASLAEARANEAEAASNVRRADQLVTHGWMSGKDYDNRHASALSAAAKVAVAEANLALAEAQLRQAEIHAPTDGTITQRSAHLGAVMSAGGTELFRMIRDDKVELIAELPETDLAQVAPGQKVTLSVDGAAKAGLKSEAVGEVRLVEPTVDAKTRIGRVRIDVAKSPELKPGMFVTGHIALGEASSPVLPEKCLVYQDGKPRVFVVGGGDKVESRPVQIGPRDHGQIAILSGVKAGERVVVLGAGYLKTGDAVSIVDAAQEPQPGSL